MVQFRMNGFEAPAQRLRDVIVFGSLLFSAVALNFYPLGSALRYYTDLLACLSLIYLFLNCREIGWVDYGRSFLYCIAPFIPLFLTYVGTKIYHGLKFSNDGIFFFQMVFIILAVGLVFGVLVQSKRITKELFFGFCAVACALYFLDILVTACYHDVPVWRVKGFVHPYSTTYAKCIGLTAGLSLLGFFLLPNSKKGLRYACFGASIIGFCSAIWFLGIRSVVLTPIFAIIIGYCASPLKLRTKVLSLVLFGLLAAILVVQSPIVSKMRLAYDEAANVISNDAVTLTLTNINKQNQSTQEVKIQKYLNTSVGARIAVWTIAERALEGHEWLGTGKGRPHNFVDTKKLFKFSKDYLQHFHNDYVQASIVGGIVLLLALLITQLWLFIRSFKDPLTLFMTLSMISYGLVDCSFFNRRVMVCYLGASIIIWSWRYMDGQSQGNGENGTT